MSKMGGHWKFVLLQQPDLMRRFAWPILIAAVLFGLVGVVYFGYASAEHYGWVLRRWLVLSLTSALLLIVVISRAPRGASIAAAVALALLVLGSIEPAYRIAHVGLFEP